MIPELTEKIASKKCKCSACGGKLTAGQTVFHLAIERDGHNKDLYLHKECASSQYDSSVWTYFYHHELGRVLRIVVYPQENGLWRIYSQTEGHFVVRWGQKYENQDDACLAVEKHPELNQLAKWIVARKKSFCAA